MSTTKTSFPPIIKVSCSGIVNEDQVEVAEFTERSSFSSLTEIELTIVTRDYSAISANDLLGSNIEIAITTLHMGLLLDRAADLSDTSASTSSAGGDGNIRRLFGSITQVVETNRDAFGTTQGPLFIFHLSVRPRLWVLGQRQRLRLCADMSVPEIVESVLKEAGFVEGKDYEFRIHGKYDKRSFTIQYNETDLAFISRLTEYWGIGYFFEHRDGRDVVIFSSSDKTWEQGMVPILPYGSGSEMLGLVDISLRRSRVPGHYALRDYSPDHPTVDWTKSGAVGDGDPGEIIEYNANFESMDEGTLLLTARLDGLTASRFIFSGQMAEAVLDVGTVVQIAGHPSWDKKNLSITSVNLAYKAGVFTGDAPSSFSLHFEGTLAGSNVRPDRRTPTPRIDGIVAAVVEIDQQDQEYAHLDKDGGYRVRLMADDPNSNPQPYARVRMMQPHGGQGYGFHFPLRPGTEVALLFIDGNPDRPVIAGTLPNAQHGSPVQSATAKSNIIRTGGGNEIQFQDAQGSERIKLTSPHDNTILQLGSPNFPNSGVTLDTLGTSNERAGVGKSLLTPVMDATSLVAKALSRKQTLTSSADEFEHDWKSLLDTPAKAKEAFDSVTALSRQMIDINEDVAGKGKAKIDQYDIKISKLDTEREILSAKLTAFEVARQKVWDKLQPEPDGFVTQDIADLYDKYNDAEANFREEVYYYSDAQSPGSSAVAKKEANDALAAAASARKDLMAAIKNDPRYAELYQTLLAEDSSDANGHQSIGQQMIDVTDTENLYRIEQEQLTAQYKIDTANVTAIERAQETSQNYADGAIAIGTILQQLILIEGAADQRGQNAGWNTAPGPLYAPGLLDLEAPATGPSYLTQDAKQAINTDFTDRNFIRGWPTAHTEVSADHAVTLRSDMRMLQSAKIIAVNAWCNEPDYVDPAKSAWEKFKQRTVDQAKSSRAAKAAGYAGSAPNFLLSFANSPITAAITSASAVMAARMPPLEETPESPAGTLLLRGENRTLVTSDRHVEIGTPVVDITAKTIKSCASNDIIMMSGNKEGSADWSYADDSSSLIQLAKNGSAIIWANNKIEIGYSEDKCQLPVVSSIQPTGSEEVEVPAAAGGDSDMTKVLLSSSGLVLQAQSENKIKIVVGEELSATIDNESFKFTSKESSFEHSSSQTTINPGESGKVSVQAGTISLKSGENELTIAQDGITINGMKLSLQGKESVELSGQGTVSVKGIQVQVQGTAETSIGSGSSPTMVQGATVMLG